MKSSNEWISISDMMTGLMMVFLFISVLYISQIKKIANEHYKDKDLIHEALDKEFGKDLNRWNAELDEKDLVIRFLSPQIMFSPKKSIIKKKYKSILSDFCPRYFRVLKEFDAKIKEIRIEGHTSKEWHGASQREGYLKNMELSQDRTRSVLRFCTNKKTFSSFGLKDKKWIKDKLTANGLSSSRPLCKKRDTVRCRSKNRRVDFRVQVDESRILKKISREISSEKK